MQISINIDDAMGEGWQDRIQRQVDFKLSTFRSVIEALVVHLVASDNGVGQGAQYRCTMRATLKSGRYVEADMRGPMANICVADACARLRRAVGRDQTLRQPRVQAEA